MAGYFAFLLKGLFNTAIITVVSCIIPGIIGVVFNSKAENNNSLQAVGKVVGNVFNSFSIIPLLCCLFYVVFKTSVNAVIISCIAFSLAYIGYMPAHYNQHDSVQKNIVVNGIGMVSSILKWSPCVAFIGCNDLFSSARIIFSRTYSTVFFVIVLGVYFAILLVINFAKLFAETKMS